MGALRRADFELSEWSASEFRPHLSGFHQLKKGEKERLSFSPLDRAVPAAERYIVFEKTNLAPLVQHNAPAFEARMENGSPFPEIYFKFFATWAQFTTFHQAST